MLDVFFHSGFDVTSHLDYGTVALRFPLAPTAKSEAARAARQAKWHVERDGNHDRNPER